MRLHFAQILNLSKCAGLYAALEENVNGDGEIPTFLSFPEQKAKRLRQVIRTPSSPLNSATTLNSKP